ncbi:hypothetical protein KIH74_01765 [Kineosporia sp. J2-2]|uniref:DNA-directed RNA polymerase subunit beta n=1 Tax=Kineosporia corallincola TaxID=2835133 RepID=A0ABS5T982_9ACTN|nr:hypothetical protein [Kineosporia corallincola]MBT0767632.1 hypothetical protein [Kineosporia corallincola]
MTSDRSAGYVPPRRPAFFGPAVMDTFQGAPDPGQRIEAAHRTAAALVDHARGGGDPAATARIVALADVYGLDEIAELWAARPARTLPGALWRIYALQAGIRRDPVGMARAFDSGRHRAPVHEAVAGVAEPPGPTEVQDMADAILGGAFTGDLAVALERAAAFCHVVATGLALEADHRIEPEEEGLTRRAGGLARTGTDLEAAARMWREGDLS